MSFAEVLKQVKSLSYEVIIFDTAPTGHTLRFLQFPTVLEKALAKLSQLSTQFGPMLNSVLGARGGLPNGQSLDDMLAKMESLRETISEVNTQFKNPDMTTFVCVCIAEFLSLYETERMIQELASYQIDTHAIVVNQLLFPKKSNSCEQCNARRKMQKKYLDQIDELYDEFNVVKMPLLVEEVRGKEKLEKFVFPKTGKSFADDGGTDFQKCLFRLLYPLKNKKIMRLCGVRAKPSIATSIVPALSLETRCSANNM